MIITCPRCFTTYRAPDRALPPSGRKVRCSSCHFDWMETPPPRDAIAGLAPNREDVSAPLRQVEPDPLPREIPRPRPAPPKPPEKSKLLPALGWLAFVLVSFVVIAYVLRAPLGHRSPILADLYEDLGVPVEGVYDWFSLSLEAPAKSESDGKTVLSLSGRITNISRRERVAPKLHLYWQGHEGNIGQQITINACDKPLKPSESCGFNGELVGVDARATGTVHATFTPPQPHKPAPEKHVPEKHVPEKHVPEKHVPEEPAPAKPAQHEQPTPHTSEPSPEEHH